MDKKILLFFTSILLFANACDDAFIDVGILSNSEQAELPSGKDDSVNKPGNTQGDKPGKDDPGENPAENPGGNPQSCTDACSGADVCEGANAYKTCKDANGDGCNAWVTIQCAQGSACTDGKCAPACMDTCSGGPECAGTNAFKTCKDNNGDGCNEWVETKCSTGMICSAAECVPACTDTCAGGPECAGTDAFKTCKDNNGDGCKEWVETKCDAKNICSGGKCVLSCSDTCSGGPACTGNKTYHTCKDANGDGCKEWVDADCGSGKLCQDGSCIDDPLAWVPECTGTGCPTVITNFKQVIAGNTSTGVSRLSKYSCAAHLAESGPEQSYVFKVNEPGTIIAGVTEPSGGDVDVHILSALKENACLARGDKGANVHVDAGVYYVVADTYAGNSNAGAYQLKITFLPDSGPCGLNQTSINHVESGAAVKLPSTGKIVQEAHLVTDYDRQIHGKNWWPSSFTDGISQHVAFSSKWTGINYQGDWCPNGEGGCEYGQGSVANEVPWKAEAWYVCMYWTLATRPKPGTRFLVVNPMTGQAIVAAAGYETGPRDPDMLGGAVYEIHKKLGTGHKSTLTFGQMKDQAHEYGPIACE